MINKQNKNSDNYYINIIIKSHYFTINSDRNVKESYK